MLHIRHQVPILGYSKGSRGLSVLARVRGILTTTAISPGPSLRQCSSRYAIHAGRNLPDKELRYLRTVIVTAAVYRGFGRQLPLRSPAPLTYRHRAGVRLYTSSCELAESCVFDKQSLEPIHCGSLTLAGESTPCTEGTGSFCRVPSRGFSRTPSDARLAHLCRIAVRADVSSPAGFSRPACRRTSGSDAVALAGRGCLAPRSVSRRRHRWLNLHVGSRNINRVPI